MRSLLPPRPEHAVRYPPLYGAGVPSPLRPWSRDPRDGYPSGTPAGNRGAPARGVDVKPSLPEAREGLPDPLEGPGGASGRSPDPVRGPGGRKGPPGDPGDRPASPARGVLHQPLAPGPRGTPGVRGGSEGPLGPGRPEKGQKSPFWAPPGGTPQNPVFGYRGAGVGKRAAQARGNPRRGCRGFPPGRRSTEPGCPRVRTAAPSVL